MTTPGILFDARVIRPGMTGIGNYARSLLRALPLDAARIGIILPEGSPYASDFPGCVLHFTPIGITAHPRTELYEQFEIPRFCRRHGYGTFVSFEGRVPLFGRDIRVCAFIYDLAYLKVAGTHGLKYSLLLRVSQWIARTRNATILTISEAVREEIVGALGFARASVHVLYPSDSGLDQVAAEAIPGARAPFVLATSMTNPRKNLGNLLKAYALIRRRHPDLNLVITGNPAWIDRTLAEVAVVTREIAHSEGSGRIVNAGFVSEGGLRGLYERADAYVYPSFDEGFGIPLLDARLFGCPVACSEIPVFREVLQDDALYFDPADPNGIAAAVESLLRSESRFDAGPEAPTLRARFSWRRSAERLLQVAGLRAIT
jgi:glycosyltransferase involved in cell wall biosynthesis